MELSPNSIIYGSVLVRLRFIETISFFDAERLSVIYFFNRGEFGAIESYLYGDEVNFIDLLKL